MTPIAAKALMDQPATVTLSRKCSDQAAEQRSEL